MQKKHQESRISAQTSSIDETETLLEQMEIELLREQIEFAREVLESQDEYLRQKEEELQDVKRELEITNNDLSKALVSPRINFEEAKAVAKIILKNEQSTSESLAELLTAIYSKNISWEELEQKELLNSTKKTMNNEVADRLFAKSMELREHSKEVQTRYQELGYKFVAFRAHLSKIREQWAEFVSLKEQTERIIEEAVVPPEYHLNE